MLKKTFILTQFGKPHSWTQNFIDSVQFLEEYGWYWKIYTSNGLLTKGNVEIIPMTIKEFNELCLRQLNLNPAVEIVNGLPSKPMSDYYVANGLIFHDWLRDTDFWGITNWDVVYGRLDNFIKDEDLKNCDIWSDDIQAINGVFSLYRNIDEINTLFKQIHNWEKAFRVSHIVGTDEYEMTKVVKNRIGFVYPKYYPLHSHDRLENHVPNIKLKRQPDNSLWELLADTNPPNWIHARPFIAREVPYFHFQRTKTWPNIA